MEIENIIETLKELNVNYFGDEHDDVNEALEAAIQVCAELEIAYKLADAMANTAIGSKEHAQAIQSYVEWVEADRTVVEEEEKDDIQDIIKNCKLRRKAINDEPGDCGTDENGKCIGYANSGREPL